MLSLHFRYMTHIPRKHCVYSKCHWHRPMHFKDPPPPIAILRSLTFYFLMHLSHLFHHMEYTPGYPYIPVYRSKLSRRRTIINIALRFHKMSGTVDVRWVRMAGIVNMKDQEYICKSAIDLWLDVRINGVHMGMWYVELCHDVAMTDGKMVGYSGFYLSCSYSVLCVQFIWHMLYKCWPACLGTSTWRTNIDIVPVVLYTKSINVRCVISIWCHYSDHYCQSPLEGL